MTKRDRLQVRSMLDALVKVNQHAMLSKAARIVFQAANHEPDDRFKTKLLVLAGEIELLDKEA